MLKKSIVQLLCLFVFILPLQESTFAQVENSSTVAHPYSSEVQSRETTFRFAPARLTSSFFLSLLIDLVFVFILVRFVYYPIYEKKDFFFTFFLFNLIIFIITFLFNRIELSTGAAFGIFAVFSLLRYRTEDISAKDMTYLFIVIALGLVNSVSKESLVDVLLLDSIVVVVAYALDGNLFIKNEQNQTIQYDNLELVKPANKVALLEDLKLRTGLDIHKMSVSKVDFLKNTASIKIYYYNLAQ